MKDNQAEYYTNVQRLSQSRLPINIISFTLWSFTINFNNLTPNYDLKETWIWKYKGHEKSQSQRNVSHRLKYLPK
jgi:hypothetical protein